MCTRPFTESIDRDFFPEPVRCVCWLNRGILFLKRNWKQNSCILKCTARAWIKEAFSIHSSRLKGYTQIWFVNRQKVVSMYSPYLIIDLAKYLTKTPGIFWVKAGKATSHFELHAVSTTFQKPYQCIWSLHSNYLPWHWIVLNRNNILNEGCQTLILKTWFGTSCC